MNTAPPPVVVGIIARQAELLSFAAEDASRRGVGLRVVHAQPMNGPGAELYAGRDLPDEAAAAGEGLLDWARALVESRWGRLATEYILATGRVRDILLQEAEHAQVVVLGADDQQWIDRLLNGDVSGFVAQHAASPVIIVPPDWRFGSPDGDVLLSVEGGAGALGPLEFAFERARAHRQPLRVLHAIPLGTNAADAENYRARVVEVMSGWAADYPDVLLDVSVSPDDPVAACLAAAHDAQLLVVGRPGGVARPFGVTRPVAVTVLRTAECPVAIVPPELMWW